MVVMQLTLSAELAQLITALRILLITCTCKGYDDSYTWYMLLAFCPGRTDRHCRLTLIGNCICSHTPNEVSWLLHAIQHHANASESKEYQHRAHIMFVHLYNTQKRQCHGMLQVLLET